METMARHGRFGRADSRRRGGPPARAPEQSAVPRGTRGAASGFFAADLQRPRRAADPAARRRQAALAAVLVEQLLQPSAPRREHGGRHPATADEELGIRCASNSCSSSNTRRNSTPTGAEHELCSVFIGRTDAAPQSRSRRDRRLALGQPGGAASAKWRAPAARDFTPWFMLEWARIWRDHRPDLPVVALDEAILIWAET